MTHNDDALSTAMEEVMSVAEELKGIQHQAKQYVDASMRMHGIGNELEKLTQSVGRVPEQFSSAISRMNELWKGIEAGKASLDKASEVMPDVIKRIESADVFRSISEFSSGIEKLENLMSQHMGSLANLTASIAEERNQNQLAFDVLKKWTNSLETKITSLQSDMTSLTVYSKQKSQEVELLKEQLSSQLANGLDAQAKMLGEVLALVQVSREEIHKSLEGISEHSSRNLRQMSTQLTDNTNAHTKMLGEVLALVQNSTEATNEAADEISEHAVNSTRDMNSLKNELENIKEHAQKQNQWLLEISKKRGLIF